MRRIARADSTSVHDVAPVATLPPGHPHLGRRRCCRRPAGTPTPTPLPTWTPAPTAVPGALAVNAGQSLGPINPLVYGTNYGPWMPIRPETLPLAEQAGLTLLRYPGGEWGDTNNLEPYQINSFVALARARWARSRISTCVCPAGTPEQAVALDPLCQRGEGLHYPLLVDRQRAEHLSEPQRSQGVGHGLFQPEMA